jgi:hypothetical protein
LLKLALVEIELPQMVQAFGYLSMLCASQFLAERE